MLHVSNCAVAVLGRVNFVSVSEVLAGGVDGTEVAQHSGVLLEDVHDGGLAGPPGNEVLERPQLPRFLHRVCELDEGEGGCLGGLLGLLASDGGLDLIKPAEGREVRGRGDAAGRREDVHRPPGGREDVERLAGGHGFGCRHR